MEEDKKKTSSIIEVGAYYYTTMPFELENATATNKSLVNKLFKSQIGRNMEIYVDDMLIKSETIEQLILDLWEIFTILK